MSGDGIFLIHDDGRMVEMQAEPFVSEDFLQQLLADYPAIMAGGQINSAVPRRFLLIDREVGVPGSESGHDRFSLDHLFVDQDAVPTIVEVKRSSDTRIRREVVGQMLDYAANGVKYWPIHVLRTRFDQMTAGRELDSDGLILELLGGDGDIDAFWKQVDANLRAGRIRMLFVADRVPQELQRIVEFLNEQMDPAEVFAIELRHYRGEGVRTLVPRVMGATAMAQSKSRQRDTRSFDEFFSAASSEIRDLDALLVAWAIEYGLDVSQSPQARHIEQDGQRLLEFYITDGTLVFHLTRLAEAGFAAEVEGIRGRLKVLAGRRVSNRHPEIKDPGRVLDRWDKEVRPLLSDFLSARRALTARVHEEG